MKFKKESLFGGVYLTKRYEALHKKCVQEGNN